MRLPATWPGHANASSKKRTSCPNTPIIHRNLSDMKGVLNQLVYQKGGWVLHMLRQEIGTDRFWAGIRDYYRRYRDQNASTDDLRQVMEQVSGKDLRWFFTQWLNRSGVPFVEGGWRFAPDRQRLEVTLRQTQQVDPFRLNVEIGIVDDDGATRVERLAFETRENHFVFAVKALPKAVVLDPNTALMARIGALTQH